MPIILRTATTADVDTITDIHTLARTAYYRAGGHSDPDLTSAESRAARREAWSRAVESADREALCAIHEGEITGVVLMGPPHDPDPDLDPATTGQLYQIHVRPGSWGAGVGSRLHEGFVRFLRERSLSTGVLEAWERNSRARAFYARHGWRPDGHRRPGPCGAEYVRLRLELGKEA
ncbi:N-acetyltransferase family protein [Streptomyces sp. CA-249302]|uniref:GNAT family N-acetyltransferase n=1 Tax=Streptomyces sp. CA-249302 TaxID=3240058 RepID=UPI003D8C1677